MDAVTFNALAAACAPKVALQTSRAVAQVESSFNPYAIGVVGGSLIRQPSSAAEAKATAHKLAAGGWNFSLGLGQINIKNLKSLGLSIDAAFDPCSNLRAMQTLLQDCFARARGGPSNEQLRLRQALSCYYSGNFEIGFRHGYVRRLQAAVPNSVARPFKKELS